MSSVIASYWKTIIASFVVGLVVITIAYMGQAVVSTLLPVLLVVSLGVIGWSLGVFLLLIAFAGLLVNYRQSRLDRGEVDLFLVLNKTRSEAALLDQKLRDSDVIFSSLRRWLGAPAFIVGDRVQIRSLAQIFSTLDENGCLEGLPFMPEMAKHCGATGTVFRCVDKIYDYGGRKDMRRIQDTVLIAGLRCDGGAHGDCEAKCYILWKTAWVKALNVPLRPSPSLPIEQSGDIFSDTGRQCSWGPTLLKDDNETECKYSCQYTNLVQASTRLRSWDLRQDLRPLIAGNLTVMAFGAAILTRLFNIVQLMRGGCDFPLMPKISGQTSSRVDLSLKPGEMVVIRDSEKIAKSLDRSGRNRGLWFDRSMLCYTKQRFTILGRVHKIIDDASGRMVFMKTPCIVLEGVDNHGEFLRFSAQHDYPFWREVWLDRLEDSKALVSAGPDEVSDVQVSGCRDTMVETPH